MHKGRLSDVEDYLTLLCDLMILFTCVVIFSISHFMTILSVITVD